MALPAEPGIVASPMRLLAPIAVFVGLLIAAVPSFAGDNGEGLVGETDDRIITFFCLGVIIFFVIVTIVGSTIQGWLERRKDERKATELRKRVGW
jgi:nitrogen fixation/metabolism regulation signal transduction histidine kinase